MKIVLIALAGFVAGSMLVLPMAAQTGIFDSLFVDSTASDALDVAGSLVVGSPILPQYLGTGARNGTRYLRDDGIWAGVSPPTAVSVLFAAFSTTSTTFEETGLSVTLTVPTSTSDVLLAFKLTPRTFSNSVCSTMIARDTTALLEFGNLFANPTHLRLTNDRLVLPLLDENPGAGTFTYTVQMQKIAQTRCNMDAFSSVIAQVLQ